MATRTTPSGQEISEALDGQNSRLLWDWDRAVGATAGAFRTTHNKAREWLRERLADGSLGWYALTVSGDGFYVVRISGEGAPDRKDRPTLYVNPGGYDERYIPRHPFLTHDRSLAVNDLARRQIQAGDRSYLVRAEHLAEVIDEGQAAEEEARKQRQEEQRRHAAAARPLQGLLQHAGVDVRNVSVTVLNDKPHVNVHLGPEEAEQVNALLRSLGFEDFDMALAQARASA